MSGKKQPWKKWTAAETEYLANNYGLITMEWLCRRLGRSRNAIQLKAGHLGINRKSNYLNASEVGRQMGIDSKTVALWIRRGLLRGRKSRNGRDGVKWWLVMPADVEVFIKKHPLVYDVARIENPYLRNLARKHVPAGAIPKLVRYWTEQEDGFLLAHHKKLTYAEIAHRLRRTKEAVHGRMVLLRKKYERKISYKAPWIPGVGQVPRWTEEEDEYLRRNWADRIKGKQKADPGEHRLTVADICAHLGRTEHAVYCRARHLGLATPWTRKPRNRKEQAA